MTGFWKGKVTLVTGGYGFCAVNLVEHLVAHGAIPVVVSRQIRDSSVRTSTGAEQDAVDVIRHTEWCDLYDVTAVEDILQRRQIDVIFHLAASTIVQYAAKAPFGTIRNNVVSTLSILEAARRAEIPATVVASSDKAYGDHSADQAEPLPYSESYALRALDAYGASKACTDIVAQSYATQFELPVVIARPCNVYGPGDVNFTRIIPGTIMRLLTGNSPILHAGNQHVKREYVFVDDVSRAYLFLAQSLYEGNQKIREHASQFGGIAFNIGDDGSGTRTAVEVIEMLRSRVGGAEPVVTPKSRQFVEVPDQFLDCSKLTELGFKPDVPFERGLDRTVDWYSHNQERFSRLAATIAR